MFVCLQKTKFKIHVSKDSDIGDYDVDHLFLAFCNIAREYEIRFPDSNESKETFVRTEEYHSSYPNGNVNLQ